MDILLLCGYFEECYYPEINAKTKTWVENAANTFQKRLIAGLKEQDIKLSVVSAPFIGPWPTAYKDILFKGFQKPQIEANDDIEYVSFNNIWGYRNISRAQVLKKAVKNFISNSKKGERAIIVYSPHTPFLEAAVYGKKIAPDMHIQMVVPDLPQYMNLSEKKHPIYDFFKKIDIEKLLKLNADVDSYMLLTEPMKNAMEVGNRPYFVQEGIVENVHIEKNMKKHDGIQIAYAGKLNEIFGVRKLIEAFYMINNEKVSLEICGGGELQQYVKEACAKDNRIHYHGVISAENAASILQEADVLVNPRSNEGEYTKYSFPSKNIEYLATGNQVVAYKLAGMPTEYENLIIIPTDNSTENLSKAILKAISQRETNDNSTKVQSYLTQNLMNTKVAEKLIKQIANNTKDT